MVRAWVQVEHDAPGGMTLELPVELCLRPTTFADEHLRKMVRYAPRRRGVGQYAPGYQGKFESGNCPPRQPPQAQGLFRRSQTGHGSPVSARAPCAQ